jgi:hypothetical protein
MSSKRLASCDESCLKCSDTGRRLIEIGVMVQGREFGWIRRCEVTGMIPK